MNIHKLVRKSKKIVSDNSPVLLTAVGVTGTITTAYLAARASFKAAKYIEEEQCRLDGFEKSHPLTKKEKSLLIWKLYIPAVLTGAATCACVVGANYIGTKRAAALAAAYSMAKEAADEYQSKVVDKLGRAEEKQLRDELAQERAKKDASKSQEVVFVVGDSLCHDAYSGRYFMCDKEKIRRAENDINYEILHSDFATLQDFYDYLKLEETSVSREMGWNAENPCAITFATVEAPDGRPCLSYDFAVVPIRDPWRFR